MQVLWQNMPVTNSRHEQGSAIHTLPPLAHSGPAQQDCTAQLCVVHQLPQTSMHLANRRNQALGGCPMDGPLSEFSNWKQDCKWNGGGESTATWKTHLPKEFSFKISHYYTSPSIQKEVAIHPLLYWVNPWQQLQLPVEWKPMLSHHLKASEQVQLLKLHVIMYF